MTDRLFDPYDREQQIEPYDLFGGTSGCQSDHFVR